MFLGLLSDTHGHVELTRQAMRMFAGMEVERILHCGDIGSTAIVSLLACYQTDFVLGNVDDRSVMVRAITTAGLTCHGRFGELEIEGRRIALLHGDDVVRLKREIASGQHHLVCHGHTHTATMYQKGVTRVVNPGALAYVNRPSVAVVRLPSLEVIPIWL